MIFLCMPVAWPIAKVLDAMFGHSSGALYRRAEMSTLVTLGKESGNLSDNEATIMEGALSMATKRCSQCMTPMREVYSLASDAVLNEATMEWMRGIGRSRIPVYKVGSPGVLHGAILLKRLLGHRAEDATPVNKLQLTPLVHVSEDIHLFDLLAFFQTGRSHMAVVYARDVELKEAFAMTPPGASGLGIVTMEDVIEELIRSEIVDECDSRLYAIERLHNDIAPAPMAQKNTHIAGNVSEASSNLENGQKRLPGLLDVLRRVASTTFERDGSEGRAESLLGAPSKV